MMDSSIAHGTLVHRDGVTYPVTDHSHNSGVSWDAIFAGAAGAASLSLILLILGVGLGTSSVSPWSQAGVSAATFGISTILWLTFTQLAASAVGGYLAGRLRRRWAAVHADEVFFRDTAHGFLAWAIATLVTAGMLTGVIGSIVGGGVQAGATVAGAAATTAAAGGAAVAGAGRSIGSGEQGSSYFVDSLFRRDSSMATATGTAGAPGAAMPMNAPTDAAPTAEAGRIFLNSLSADAALPATDVKYLGQLVAQRTGMSQQDAEKRVTDTYQKMQAKAHDAAAKAREAADQARKASAYGALWLFVSLLIGAFVASFMATTGGRQRDI